MNDDDPELLNADGDPAPPRTAPDVVEALLELARSAAEDELSRVLESVANTILITSGYRTVVLNVFRPAWNDYEAVLIVGRQDGSEIILGSTAPRDVIENLVATGNEVLPGVHLLTDSTAVWDQLEHFYTPDLTASAEPDAWQPEDALLVMLRDAGGGPLGFVSVDEPAGGRRPRTPELRLLRSVCSYAEQALRSAQRSRRAEDDKQLLERLSRVSPRLSRCGSRDELYGMVTMVVVAGLGFERVALYAADGLGELTLRQSRGPDGAGQVPVALSVSQLERLLVPARRQSGCWLVGRRELVGDAEVGEVDAAVESEPHRSRRNGVGPLAWADHALLIPWYSDSELLAGVLVVEDPVDHLLPSEERRSAARLLVDLAASVGRSVEQQERLVEQASYDALTGLRNRRGLHKLITSSNGVAVLLCDIDHFKKVNDEYGHELGDGVLRVFGELLSDLTVGDDVAVRLGGEEFCVVLPNRDRPSALRIAERLREATPGRTEGLVTGGVTVSVGIAVSSDRVRDARVLLSTADRGLYAAKRGGRNRVVVADQGSGRRHTDLL
jgi:diguanylate cyclase (GGDEF)-like protein